MFKKPAMLSICSFMLSLAFCAVTLAQGPMADPPLDQPTRTEVIEGVLKKINDLYVFPDVAKQIERSIRDRVSRKEYDSITSGGAFASTLTADLREISHDKHMTVLYSPRVILPGGEETPDAYEKRLASKRTGNFSFDKVERLTGNVGYLYFSEFLDPSMAADTAVAAMSFLANSDAVIVDLRRNGGGSPEMVALMASYFFDDRPVQLTGIFRRETNEIQQWWTLPHVAGKRLGTRPPVYILTSKATFSAAEQFAYDLQSLKRALIIGEVTGGGANPGRTRQINDHFSVYVSNARAVNPITKTNWEGVGVQPDLKVIADQALNVAHIEAVKKLIDTTKDPARVEQLKRVLDVLQKQPGDSK